MKYALILILAASLSGCFTMPWKPEKIEPTIVVKQEYILRIPPAESMTFPPEVADIDVDKSTQGEVASWIVLKEEQIKAFKAKLIEIAKFLTDEKTKLDDEAKKKNAQ